MDVAVLIGPAAGRGRARALSGAVLEASGPARAEPPGPARHHRRRAERPAAEAVAAATGAVVTDRADRLRWPRGRRWYDVAVLAEPAALRPGGRPGPGRETGARAARVELFPPGVTTCADGEPVVPLPAVGECAPRAQLT